MRNYIKCFLLLTPLMTIGICNETDNNPLQKENENNQPPSIPIHGLSQTPYILVSIVARPAPCPFGQKLDYMFKCREIYGSSKQ
ncbi:hypothetical protein WH47_12218 [Habropoda laboriosa]|uniref:Uncharacterized protein n=1 Tax=Habropoda laboriosa TaxID=597456 RepID=A0A0L7RAM5_9HYME|nr:hypothetical protein WH47_12218 [Habropoda laboriosa]